ncbi:hypothetical protein [Chitinivorax sp. B]|uniref:hypothetical protein n=1 Tax=Chitinivorax sp. B TaxID=2502235 RepID=UPI0014854EDA|nr:hypothetical protein [Chitinivorax sp. B]
MRPIPACRYGRGAVPAALLLAGHATCCIPYSAVMLDINAILGLAAIEGLTHFVLFATFLMLASMGL